MESFFSTQPASDPRICRQWEVGHCQEGLAVSVTFALGQLGSEKIVGVSVMTPAEARHVALELWDAAEKADRVMNEAVTVKEGA